MENEMATLYEKLGGGPAVDAAVDLFYSKVVDDKRVSHFFDGVNIGRQSSKQKAFLTKVFGGPDTYKGRSMRASHKKTVDNGLNDTHFDVVVELLGESLRELGVAEKLIDEVAKIAESIRNDVLNREAVESR